MVSIRNQQERKGLAIENHEVMPGWHDCRTVPNLSVSCFLSYIHLFQSLSFSAWVSVTLCSDKDCLQHLLEQSLMMPTLPILSQSSSNLSILKNLPSAVSIFSACLSILMLSLPSSSTHTFIQYSYFRGHLWVCVYLHHFQHRGNLHLLLKHSPVPLLFLIELIQILVLVSCCSSFFRLKAMCHSLLLSLCLFLHLFLLLPPTQSLSPLPTPFSLLSVDVIVCELLTASVCLFMR